MTEGDLIRFKFDTKIEKPDGTYYKRGDVTRLISSIGTNLQVPQRNSSAPQEELSRIVERWYEVGDHVRLTREIQIKRVNFHGYYHLGNIIKIDATHAESGFLYIPSGDTYRNVHGPANCGAVTSSHVEPYIHPYKIGDHARFTKTSSITKREGGTYNTGDVFQVIKAGFHDTPNGLVPIVVVPSGMAVNLESIEPVTQAKDRYGNILAANDKVRFLRDVTNTGNKNIIYFMQGDIEPIVSLINTDNGLMLSINEHRFTTGQISVPGDAVELVEMEFITIDKNGKPVAEGNRVRITTHIGNGYDGLLLGKDHITTVLAIALFNSTPCGVIVKTLRGDNYALSSHQFERYEETPPIVVAYYMIG